MSHEKGESWYTRPVVFVADVPRAITFYSEKLGFVEAWSYEDNGRVIVAQVNRGSKCEIILSEDLSRSGMSRLFIELWPEELTQLKLEIETNKIEFIDSSWGMPIIEIKDPFGNELYFPID